MITSAVGLKINIKNCTTNAIVINFILMCNIKHIIQTNISDDIINPSSV